MEDLENRFIRAIKGYFNEPGNKAFRLNLINKVLNTEEPMRTELMMRWACPERLAYVVNEFATKRKCIYLKNPEIGHGNLFLEYDNYSEIIDKLKGMGFHLRRYGDMDECYPYPGEYEVVAVWEK